MKLLLDYAAIVNAQGGTITWTKSGTATQDPSFPASNLFDNTTRRNGYALKNYCRATWTATQTLSYAVNLGSSHSNARTMIVSGVKDEAGNTLGLNSTATGVGAAATASMATMVFYDVTGAATKKTLTRAAGSFYTNVTTPTVVLRAAAAFSSQQLRLDITTDADGAVQLGYIGVYGDIGTIDPTGLSVASESQSATGFAESGTPYAASRAEARSITVPFSRMDQATRELIEQLTRYHHLDLSVLDPRTYPVLALYFDELDTGTTEGEIATNLQSGMYLLDDSVGFQFAAGAAKLRPDAALTFRRWA